ncbi:unnamed protein product [Taenia asiatica]|uniref:MICOS complex subunit MIC10 n=1 Tax=Taenia asiatica TaxID=60517 RepID=A0A0R3VVI1_TAEAS|nr:unnamed protein product [Taenia asiatica]
MDQSKALAFGAVSVGMGMAVYTRKRYHKQVDVSIGLSIDWLACKEQSSAIALSLLYALPFVQTLVTRCATTQQAPLQPIN